MAKMIQEQNQGVDPDAAGKTLRVTEICKGFLTAELELPWPPRQLSPNARGHWAVTAKAKKAYRARCAAIGRQAGVGVLLTGRERLAVHLAFFPPDRRPRDWDNLLASMKAGLDGLADAMEIDDSRWRLSFEVEGQVVKGGVVLVTLGAE